MRGSLVHLAAALSGRYTIERELGAGGMATVYLAHDLKHDRKVALKVLKPELAAVVGAERFLAEIKTTANLQHPHILPLFDSGTADSFLYYVMPYVEGESLRERLDREGELPVEEAVRIATAVANALDYAHRHGVIHRDIKPANILLHDGQPLVADFGIALAVSAAGGGRLTETGLSLGTPYYMSPEQATAERDPDPRSDVYALGCVLYEMLVGEPPYTGATAQAVLGKILTTDPSRPTEHRRSIPAHVEATVLKALEKRPADRFGGAGDLAAALSDPAFLHGEGGRVAAVTVRSRLRGAVWGGALAIMVGALSLGWWLGRASGSAGSVPGPVVRFTLPVPGGYENTVSNEVPSIAVSPDGRTLVYREGGKLMRRFLDWDAAEAIPGTEGAESPFFSPDGLWLGFLQDEGFKRMSRDGIITSIGTAAIDWVHGVDWAEDGTIVYGRSFLGIWQMTVEGGEPKPITDPSTRDDEQGHMWPQALEGGSLLLYSAIGPSGKWHDSKVILQDLESGQRTTLVEGGAYGRYLPTGHLVYATEDGAIQARTLDLRTRLVGPSVPMESGVSLGQWGGGAMFAVSPTGTLAYIRADGTHRHRLEWYDRSGRRLGALGEPMTVAWGLEIDPTGGRVAATLPNSRNDDIHFLEEGLESPRRVTSAPASDGWPVWSPDGTLMAWQRDVQGMATVLVREVDVEREPRTVHEAQGGVWPRSWSPDGRWLAISQRQGTSGQDIVAIDMENPGEVMTVMDGPEEEWDPQFSRDGRFLAFDSNESGPFDTHVIPFPPAGDPVRVRSSGKSSHPRWSPTRNELYFWSDTTLMAARYRSEPSFAVEEVRALFTVPDYVMSDDPYYAVTPDGERFLIQVHNPEAAVNVIHVVLNWNVLLSERVVGG